MAELSRRTAVFSRKVWKTMAKRGPKRITKRALREALKAAGGIVSLAARRLGVDRRTVYYHLSRDRRLQEELETFRRLAVLMAEQVVFEALRKGDFEAARFVLRSLGARYGWSQRQSIALEHKAEMPSAVKIEVVRA